MELCKKKGRDSKEGKVGRVGDSSGSIGAKKRGDKKKQ